jgi:hypothetical protein
LLPAFIGDVTKAVNGTVLTLSATGVTAAAYGGNNSIPSITVDAKGRVTAASTVTPSGTWAISIIGDVTGDVTGNLTGNVTGNLTGNVTGNLTGNVTGNLTGNVTGNVTGNASTATSLVTSNFTVVEAGGVLQFKYGSTVVMSMSSTGNLTAASNITAYGTP